MINIGKLRNIKDHELELMLSWRNNPNIRSKMYMRHIINKEEHLIWWKKIQQQENTHYFMFEANEKPLGIVSFNNINHKNYHSSWAFYTSPDAPHGTGSLMEYLALEYAFDELNLHKLHCEVLAHNQTVLKMHHKFGFKVEGVLRDHYHDEEDFTDVYCLGLLKEEWYEVRDAMGEKILRLFKKSTRH